MLPSFIFVERIPNRVRRLPERVVDEHILADRVDNRVYGCYSYGDFCHNSGCSTKDWLCGQQWDRHTQTNVRKKNISAEWYDSREAFVGSIDVHLK